MSVRSFITLRQLTPRPWDIVAVFWARLLQWAKQKDVIVADPDARVYETMHGTRVVFEPRFPWDHPYRTGVTGRTVSVRPGYVGDDMPTIEGVSLDGYDADGVEKAAPVLTLAKDDGPGADGRSYVCLRMLYDVSRRQTLDADPDWLTIVHVPDLATTRTDAGPSIAYEPLAIIYWRGGKPDRCTQIVHHNLKHSFLPGEGAGTGKHFFSAV
jgi:hypothetical protein